jgi:hypothetical protein
VFIAVCRFAGDDTAIALDYRTDAADPRVVASAYDEALGYRWLEVAPSFSAFVERLAAERVVITRRLHRTGPAVQFRTVERGSVPARPVIGIPLSRNCGRHDPTDTQTSGGHRYGRFRPRND